MTPAEALWGIVSSKLSDYDHQFFYYRDKKSSSKIAVIRQSGGLPPVSDIIGRQRLDILLIVNQNDLIEATNTANDLMIHVGENFKFEDFSFKMVSEPQGPFFQEKERFRIELKAEVLISRSRSTEKLFRSIFGDESPTLLGQAVNEEWPEEFLE